MTRIQYMGRDHQGLFLWQRILRFLLLFVALPIVLVRAATALGYGQAPDGVVPAPDDNFPFVLLIPYFIGTTLHFLKKMQEAAVSFQAWFVQNGIMTVVSLAMGLGSLFGTWAMANHGGFSPVTPATWLAVFWMGFGADA